MLQESRLIRSRNLLAESIRARGDEVNHRQISTWALIIGVAILTPRGAEPQAGAQMSPLDILIAKDQIREQLGQYTLLLDGDGLTRDPNKWAEKLFTEDATFQSIGPDGQLLHGAKGLVGRAEIARTFGGGPPRTGTSARPPADPTRPQMVFRHYPVDLVFDELTPTSAKTRTSTIIMTGPRNYVTPNPPTVNPALVVYHDTWQKTADGWKKSNSILRYTTCTGTCASYMQREQR
jgi:hypothetical protein